VITLGLFLAIFVAGCRPQPNFLLIVADDLTWTDLGFTGSPNVATPHLDRLAAEGIQLRGMYASSSTCFPTRHEIFTGLYPIRSGAYPNHAMVYPETQSVFSHLQRLGYRTRLIGKQHVAPRENFPFEHSTAFGFEAISEFMTRDASQPWMIVLASHEPHRPWTEGDQRRYRPGALLLPDWMHDNPETRRGASAYYAEITALDEQVGVALDALDASGDTENTLVLFVSEQGSAFPYGGKWSLYDNGIRAAAVARWPARVEPESSTHALMQYVDIAPTIIEAAGGDAEALETGPADADGYRGFDGRSFLPVLEGGPEEHRDTVFAQHTTVGLPGWKQPYPIRAARDHRYKLIRNLAPENEFWNHGLHGGPITASWRQDAARRPDLAARLRWLSHRPAVELYDLETDPLEQTNRAGDEDLAAVEARLTEALDEWMRQQGDRGLETEMQAASRQPLRRGPGDPARVQ
jgi:uncharacterized sulfatase